MNREIRNFFLEGKKERDAINEKAMSTKKEGDVLKNLPGIYMLIKPTPVPMAGIHR